MEESRHFGNLASLSRFYKKINKQTKEVGFCGTRTTHRLMQSTAHQSWVAAKSGGLSAVHVVDDDILWWILTQLLNH